MFGFNKKVFGGAMLQQFFHFSIETSKWNGSCNNFRGSYAKMCVPDVIKNISQSI